MPCKVRPNITCFKIYKMLFISLVERIDSLSRVFLTVICAPKLIYSTVYILNLFRCCWFYLILITVPNFVRRFQFGSSTYLSNVFSFSISAYKKCPFLVWSLFPLYYFLMINFLYIFI